MSDPWGTEDLTQALPETTASEHNTAAVAGEPQVAAEQKNPQEAGWVEKTEYDYEKYNKNNKELADETAGAGFDAPEWASNAVKYEWDEDFGDVGPAFPELERILFGSDLHVKTGIEFSKVKEIAVLQEGTIRVEPVVSFKDAGLHPIMQENVELCGYDVPTPVQAYCLPAILKGHDVIACAQTGSGKTAAFLVPTISKLMGKAKKLCAPRPNPTKMMAGEYVRAEPLIMVVCPSRELATQIFDEARRFCYRSMLRPCVIYGGGPKREQADQLRKGCDILISTPGRLCDFIDSPHILSLARLKYIILDEADELLQPDWETDMKKIMTGGDQEEGNITYMMFSATFPKATRQLAREHLAHDHVRIRVGRVGSTHSNILQKIVFVEASVKRKALTDLLFAMKPCRTIIFVNSKRTADEVDDFLFNLSFPCTSIHSDRTQREREDALRAFRTGKCPIMVATGVSARGLDIRNVMHVINYDLPNVQYGGIQEYIHRIGRTGRIGNEGLATSFYNDRDVDIADVLTKTLLETKQDVPDFLQSYIPDGYHEGEQATTVLDFQDDTDSENDEEAGVAADEPEAAVDATSWGAPDKKEADMAWAPTTPDHEMTPNRAVTPEPEPAW